MSCPFDNYSPRKIAVNGIKTRPYTIVFGPSGGIFYQNGQKYTGGGVDGRGSIPTVLNAPAVATPGCRSCHA
jgi:hypothetical protein